MNPKPVPVPLPEGVRHQRVGETTERSAHLEKLKQLFEAAPISRYLGMTLSYCENGGGRVRLPFPPGAPVLSSFVFLDRTGLARSGPGAPRPLDALILLSN